MFPNISEPSHALSFGPNQDGPKTDQTDKISEDELITLGKSIVDGSGDPFAILHTICTRFGIAPNSIMSDPRSRSQSDPSLVIHLFSALFTFLPNSTNFHLLPLFTTILQRHPPSLPHLLSSPLWLSLPSILASTTQSPSPLQTQPQPLPQPSPHNQPQITGQNHLHPILDFINTMLKLCLSSSPPTPIPNKTLLSSSLSALSSHPDPPVNANSGFSLLLLNKLECVEDETSMPVDELVAQRDALRTKIGEKEGEIIKMTEIQHEMKELMTSKDHIINTLTQELHQSQVIIRDKDQSIIEKDVQMKQKDDRMAEMTRHMEEKDAILRKKEEELKSTSDWIHKKDALIIEKDAAIRQKDNSITTLTQQTEERTTTLRKTEETLRQANETIRSKEEQNKEKDKQLQMKDETIAELTKKLGEVVAMEKRLNDKLSTTHSKVVAVEALVTEAAKDVKWIRGIVPPDNVFTIWDPTHFRKEGRRITRFGVIDSSQLGQSKTGDIIHRSGASMFSLNSGNVWQNGTKIAEGNQKPSDNSVMTMELDMNRHTLVLFVDDQRQSHSLANIPQNVRFALLIYEKDRYADILSFDVVSA
ncbi:hypothetical protein BLNAU_15716 [Blattamonas nauphoetae]|uniref:Uncharacterized protein n=1 Tax=Blattamonas nauphoetae TaxID=2049346 RepID=A0ABQ9XBP4_9EUKA|nr:hypothetical protein BLNAU_15716 [Blattamonas nauphoetae]